MKKGNALEYEYGIADHQGNTRVVFSSATPAPETKTTDFEGATNTDFLNYPTGGARSSVALFNKTPDGTYSQLLNGGNNSKIGVARTFKVYPGDKVKIEAYAKYFNPTSNDSNLGGYATALLSAFQLPAPAPGETGTPSSGLNTWGSAVASGAGPGNTDHPKAFVNILLFDKDHNFLDIAFDQIDGGEQTDESGDVPHDQMMREYLVKEAGYAYVYISNDNATQVEVYFDEVSITHTPTNIIQYNEYYPFGLQASTSWTRENNKNDFLYNAGNELNQLSGWYETMFRGYDPVLGRFMQVDPLAHVAHSMSPYQYADCNPVLLNDPLGLLSSPRDAQSAMDYLWNNTTHGGTWTNTGGGGSVTVFHTESEAATWALGNIGSLNASEPYAEARLKGIINGSSWVHYKYNYRRTSKDGSNTSFKYKGLGNHPSASTSEEDQEAPCCGGKDEEGTAMAAALAASLVLLADDATIIGVVDDVTIPVLLATAYVVDRLPKNGTQYTLRARTSGFYPKYEWGSPIPVGTVYLNAGDVWKIGETMQFNPSTGKQWRYRESERNG